MADNSHGWLTLYTDALDAKTPIVLLKFCETKKYAEDAKNGDLYANTIEYFRGLESSSGQSDKNEGAWEMPFDSIEVEDEDGNLKTIAKFGTTRFWFSGDNTIPIVCFVGIPLKDLKLVEVCEQNVLLELPFTELEYSNMKSQFGPFCMLTNYDEFKKALVAFKTKNNIEVVSRLVTYLPFESSKSIKKLSSGTVSATRDNLFYKYDEFSYQREYRLIFKTKLPPNHFFHIGKLENAEILDSSELPNVKFTISRDIYEKAKEDTLCNPAN